MAKIIPLADIHGEFLDWTHREKCKKTTSNGEIVVAAGDIHTKGRGPEFLRYIYPNCEILYVAGNHEYYGSSIPAMDDRLRKECEKYDIHFLQCDAVEIEGVRFSGCSLWTDFQLYGSDNFYKATIEAERYMRDYLAIYYPDEELGSVNADHTISIHKKHLAWLQAQQADVIITHHAPSLQGVQDGYKDSLLTAAFASDLEHVVKQMGAKYWICGHTHMAKRFQIGKTEIVLNCMGYPGEHIEGFDPALILSV